ncbi:MAG: flagellar basal body-associated FliL family protein [Myxococcota bacterium]
MADEEEENEEEQKKGGPGIVGLLLPAILAGAGAFGGSFAAGAQAAPAPAAEEQKGDENVPGPTVPLSPFVLNVADTKGGLHPMKVTLAIELTPGTDPASFEGFVPRVRDTCISYLRSLSYKEAADGRSKEKITGDILGQIKKQGAETAQAVLIQDYIIQ